jgi:hypothetical protein
MAMMDAKLVLSEDIALPASVTSEYSTNEIHWEAGKDAFGVAMLAPNIAQGTPIFFNFVMNTTAATASGSPTLQLDLVADTTTAPTTVVQQICTLVADTTLVAGYRFSCALQTFPAWPAYMRLKVSAATAGFDVGTYTAWLSMSPCADV